MLVFATVYVDDLLTIGEEEHTPSAVTLSKGAFKITKILVVRYLINIEIECQGK